MGFELVFYHVPGCSGVFGFFCVAAELLMPLFGAFDGERSCAFGYLWLLFRFFHLS